MKRSSGVLLPVSALPSPHGIGTFGAEAYRFIDFLAAAGYAVEQGVLAREDEKFYRAFTARKTGVPYPVDYFGMHRGDPLYLPYLEREERRTAAALAGLRSARSPDPARIKAAETLLQSIRRAML